MTRIFLFILGVSVSVSLIIIVLLLLAPFLNKRYAAKWKYLIWIFLAVRLLVPFSGVNGQPAMEMPQENRTVSGQKDNYADDRTGVKAPYRRIVVEIPAQMTVPINAQSEKSSTGITMLDIAAFIWAIGSLVLISVHLISYFHYKRQVIKRGKLIKDASVLSRIARMKRELHIGRTIRVMEYREAESPMIVGFLKPVVVLPKERYSPEELAFILKHELVHLKRGDVYLKLLFVTANAVHWFNPLVWIMQKEAILDMELSCDERVTKGTSYALRKAYTETLLSMIHRRCVRRSALTTQFYGGKKVMKKRFKNILMKNEKKNGIFILICAVVLTISFGMLAGCSVTEKDTGSKNTGNESGENEAVRNVSDRSAEEAAQMEQTPDEPSDGENDTLENTTMLTFSKEGEQEQKPAALVFGDGYSIYLPDDEWQQSDPGTWTAAVNEQVQLWITRFEGESMDSVAQKLEEDGYTPEEDGYMWKQEEDLTCHVSLKSSENDVWGVFYSYPADFEEGWGRELVVIADTFALSMGTDDVKSDISDSTGK